MQATATAGGSVQNGIALTVKVLTSASASQPGAVAGVAGTTPSQAITPSGTGSWVYGANLGLAGTYTANAATTPYLYDVAPGDGLEHVHMRTAATTTSGTPVTVGGTATANSISVALAELLAAGALAEGACRPPNVSHSAARTISPPPLPP